MKIDLSPTEQLALSRMFTKLQYNWALTGTEQELIKRFKKEFENSYKEEETLHE